MIFGTNDPASVRRKTIQLLKLGGVADPSRDVDPGIREESFNLWVLKTLQQFISIPGVVTGSITGPASPATVGSASTFTVAASAFPVYAVLYTGGHDVGARTLVSGAGTVDLTPASTAVHRARIYTALTGGQMIDDTGSFIPAASGGGGGGGGGTTTRFFGVNSAAAPTELDDSGLGIGLSTDTVNSKAKTSSFSPAGEYCYFAYPASLGDLTFISIDGDSLNALPDFDKTTPTVVAGTSPGTYNLYRSHFQLTGTFTLAFT